MSGMLSSQSTEYARKSLRFPWDVRAVSGHEAVEQFLRAQVLSAVGELLDIAFLNGAGGSQPLGLLNTPGINTQSGTSLAHAGLLAMKQKALTAGGRERSTGGGRFLWDDGYILGGPASATKNAPVGALTVGDFSSAVVGVFGPGIRVDIGPSQDFNNAGLAARVVFLTDVVFPQPSAFTVATSVT